MRIAILSDIHANIEALVMVLAEIKAQQCDRVFCLGDIVGYGANPVECLHLVRRLDITCVKGNHDEACACDLPLGWFNPSAAKSVEWTRAKLAEEDKRWLNSLPYTRELREFNMTLAHANMYEPEGMEYVFGYDDARKSMRHQNTTFGFIGHTHQPWPFGLKPDGSVIAATNAAFEAKPGCKYLVNVGSVGQPRNQDPRSTYAIYEPDGGRVEFHQVAYPVALTAEKIRRAGLPEKLAARLSEGR